MTASKQAIKSRIASVDSTKKITNAMQLVASAKLAKARTGMEQHANYSEDLLDLLALILERSAPSEKMLKGDPNKPSFIFVITSDMGLCGAYNANMLRNMKDWIKEGDQIVVIGSRGAGWFQVRGIPVRTAIVDLKEEDAYTVLADEMSVALELFKEGTVGSVKVAYTHYKNTLTFIPEIETLLPPEKKSEITPKGRINKQVLFEPKRSTLLSEIMPMVTKSALYSKYLESKTSEQASRRMAMESATDNAEELLENLNLQYNRIRQGAITQEITEIVSGANALK